MAEFVAVREIDFPLGSGVRAFNPGDKVPADNVKRHGYDQDQDGAGPLVARTDKPAHHAHDKPADKPADKS